ncbi:MAG: hypothetical protein ABEK01_01165 [Candidatus Nanohaloarchaea archaeon]
MSSEEEEIRASDFLFMDVDGTWIEEDTGLETFVKAGECEPEEYGDLMSRTHEPGRGEPEEGRGNELLLSLSDREDVGDLREVARSLEAEPREGLNSLVKDLHDEDLQVVAHSAGWEPAIEAVTNGYFDGKIYGVLDEEPEFNGRYQKPARMQNYILQNGFEDPVEEDAAPIFIGDSNTDVEAIRYAAAAGGYGVAIGESLDEAMEVEEASLYSADEEDHGYTAAVLYKLSNPDADVSSFVEEYGLELSGGRAVRGELAEDDEYLRQAIEEVEKIA